MIDFPTLQVIGWIIVGATLLSFALLADLTQALVFYYHLLAAMTPNVASPSMLLDQPGMATKSG
ncbi:hypothetical protein [Piscirickettsia salmonis]|uniref:hypothetical protein n=1 Tax=Piscirickettsia salmonis TaxID=1238 RepID=UPI001EE481FF|nr:hypothetical protein [Piscirickettsia salmonis]